MGKGLITAVAKGGEHLRAEAVMTNQAVEHLLNHSYGCVDWPVGGCVITVVMVLAAEVAWWPVAYGVVS